MLFMRVCPNSSQPFISIMVTGENSANMNIRDITPAELRKVADEWEVELAKAEKARRIIAALEAEGVA